jgi:glycosyltransferase involved in cell wall biosynthesis
MRFNVAFNWGMSSFLGWGIYGINLALNWIRDPEVRPLCSAEVNLARVHLDPLRRRLIGTVLMDSADLLEKLRRASGKNVGSDLNVMTALGNRFATVPSAHNTNLRGVANIGVIFLEDTNIDDEVRERAKSFELIVAGSSWGRDLLVSRGIAPVVSVAQGVDPALFHPAPRARLFGDRFVVFSGGKIEFRKAQDLVMLAFRAFAERHPEALLIAAWHAPKTAIGHFPFPAGQLAPVPIGSDDRPDIAAWAGANGIKPQSFLDLGAVPNDQMPQVYREADVALFPNRCEAGTNLVAMECMACGVPTILAANTGQLELIGDGGCYPLGRQGPVAPRPEIGTEGWGESDVEEILDCLERAFADRADAARRGRAGAERLAKLDWARQTAALKQAIRPYLKAPAPR